MQDVDAGRATMWERAGNSLADGFAKKGASAHAVPDQVAAEFVGLASLAKQASRWAAEAHVVLAAADLSDTVARGAATRPAVGFPRRKRRGVHSRLRPHLTALLEGGEARAVQVNGHMVWSANVCPAEGVDIGEGRLLSFCTSCGGYWWRRRLGLPRPCLGNPPAGGPEEETSCA